VEGDIVGVKDIEFFCDIEGVKNFEDVDSQKLVIAIDKGKDVIRLAVLVRCFIDVWHCGSSLFIFDQYHLLGDGVVLEVLLNGFEVLVG